MYYSHEWVRKNILHQDEEDIKEIDLQIKKELSIPQYQRPVDMMGNDISGLPPPANMAPAGPPAGPPQTQNEDIEIPDILEESAEKKFPKYRKRKTK
jgi:hypothetical protein